MKRRHLIIGLLCWMAAAVAGTIGLRTAVSEQAGTLTGLARNVSQWLTHKQTRYQVTSETPLAVALDDPVFLQTASGEFLQVGMLVNTNGRYQRSAVLTKEFEVVLYDDAIRPLDGRFRLEYHTTPMSLAWVVQTMIPPDRQREIAALLARSWEDQYRKVAEQLKPVIREGLRTAMKTVEKELPEVLRAHRDDFRRIGERYETEILQQELIPLVKAEILPIVEEEAIPVAEDVGRELWKRVSLWSFAWRYVLDKSPLPKKNRVREEFDRFVEQEALPVLRSHSDEFIEVTESIVRRSLENPRVKEVLKRNLKRVAEDPELQQAVWNVIRDAVVENEALQNSLEEYFEQQQTKAAVKLAGDQLEPLVREIGDMIFGTREKGITPEFSRILRSQILRKDRRWFVIVPDRQAPDGLHLKAVIATTPIPYPMGFGGTAQSPLTPEGRRSGGGS